MRKTFPYLSNGLMSAKQENNFEVKFQDELFKAKANAYKATSERDILKAKSERANHSSQESQAKVRELEDIIKYLKRVEKDQQAQIEKSERRNIELSQTRENEHEKAASEQKSLEEEHVEEVRKLKRQIAEQKRQIDVLEEFRAYKETIENELSEYQEMLRHEKVRRDKREQDLERKYLVQQELWKKDMENEMKETKQRLVELTRDELHDTTKRTMAENITKSVELQYQSKETENMLEEIQVLKKKVRSLNQENVLHGETEQKLAKRSHFLQKLVDQLRATVTKLEYELQDAEEMLKSKPKTDGNVLYQAKMEIYRDAEKTVNECHQEIKKCHNEAKYYQKQFKKFLEMQDDTLVFIWNCLADARKEMKELRQSKVKKKITKIRPVQELNLQERESLLDSLFRKLNGLNTGHDFMKYAIASEKQAAPQSPINLRSLQNQSMRTSRLTSVIKRSTFFKHGPRSSCI